MSGSDESFDAGRPASPEAVCSDESFDVGPLPRAGNKRAVGHLGRPRDVADEGPFGAWLLREVGVSSASGSRAAPGPVQVERHVVSLARVTWRFSLADPAPGAVAALGSGGSASRVAVSPWGSVAYYLEDVFILDHPVLVPADFDPLDAASQILLYELCRNVALGGSMRTVADFVESYDLWFSRVLCLPSAEAMWKLGAARPALLYAVPLTLRTRPDSLVADFPPIASVMRWRRNLGVRRAPARVRGAEPAVDLQAVKDRIMLELPPSGVQLQVGGSAPSGNRPAKLDKRCDPLKTLNAVAFSLHLRNVEEFSDALQDAALYDADPAGTPPERDRRSDHSRRNIERNKAKLDIVGMLVQQRKFHAEVAAGELDCINVYSDGSPVVGKELQGMVCDFCYKDGRVRRVVLPGASLDYGHFDAQNKTLCLVHAIWLICGPDAYHMEAAFGLISSLTTDFGIEIRTADMPNCIKAYLAWMGGMALHDVKSKVEFGTRLFLNALRIAGWNHSLASVVKKAMKECDRYPEYLDMMRLLCSFFHNDTYREYLGRAVSGRVPEAKKLLKSFSASFAKWRYETLFVVMGALLALRVICEGHLREALFQNVQDRAQLQGVVRACRDPGLWTWMAAVHEHLLTPLERLRRWGMVCYHEGCHDLRRDGQRHVSCPQNSRRLHQAWAEVTATITSLNAKADSITLAECGGSNYVWNLMNRSLMRVATAQLRTRFRYLSLLPWCFVHADCEDGAVEILRQWRLRPPEDHDPLTVALMTRFTSDVEQVAARGAPSQALSDKCRVMRRTPLDESPGEGYHRGTNHEHVRAPSATTAHLKQHGRIKSVVAELRAFMAMYHGPGRDVVRYEMLHWQRILQTDVQKRWQRKRLHPQMIMARVYREDDMAREDWSSICQPVREARPVVTEHSGNREQLEREYLACVLRPGSLYCVRKPAQLALEDGTVGDTQQDVYFDVVQVQQSRSRDHTMHTFLSADDPLKVSGLMLQVRMLEKWDPPEGHGEDGLQVMVEGDDEWMPPSRLAGFADLSERLSVFRKVDPAETRGVLTLSDCQVARPPYPLTDDRVPTLTLVKALLGAGWQSYGGSVDHRAVPIDGGPLLPFDFREAVRMKAYYMCLAQISVVLPLAGGILPSQQPVAYYKCLLRGDPAVAGQGAKAYTLQWNRGRMANPDDLLALPPPEAPPLPLLGGEDFDVHPPGWEEPAPRRGGGRGPLAAGRGRAGGRGGRGGGRGGAVAPPAPLPGPAPLPLPAPPAAGEDFEAGAIVAPPGPPPPRALRSGADRGTWLDGLDGATIMFDPYVNPRTGRQEFNWKLKCRFHENCVKRRGAVPRFEARHGLIEPLGFLQCWETMETPSSIKVKSHVMDEPLKEAVDAYIAERAADLRDMLAKCNR